jgi:hypothetical protein
MLTDFPSQVYRRSLLSPLASQRDDTSFDAVFDFMYSSVSTVPVHAAIESATSTLFASPNPALWIAVPPRSLL